jgi:hypothetical protein
MPVRWQRYGMDYSIAHARERCRDRQSSIALRVENMQVFPRFEAHSLPRRNVHFGPGSWVTANPGLARTDIEDTKAAKLDPVSIGQGLLETFKNSVHRSLSLHSRQTGPFDNVMDDVLFNQCLHSETRLEF